MAPRLTPGGIPRTEALVMSFLRHGQIYQSDLPYVSMFRSALDFRGRLEEDDNALAGSPVRHGSWSVAAGQPTTVQAPVRVHRVTALLAPSHPPKWPHFSPPPTRYLDILNRES